MKRHHRLMLVLPVVFVGSLCGRAALAQGSRAVSITVNVTTDRENKGQGASAVQVTEKKTLQITVANLTGTVYPALKVKYCLFGKAADDKKVSATRSGDEDIKLASMGKTKVESAPVSFVFTPRHSEKAGKSNVTVPAAGEKYAGYGIQVFNGETLLAEAVEPVDLKPMMQAEMQRVDKEAKEDKDKEGKDGGKKKDKAEKAQ